MVAPEMGPTLCSQVPNDCPQVPKTSPPGRNPGDRAGENLASRPSSAALLWDPGLVPPGMGLSFPKAEIKGVGRGSYYLFPGQNKTGQKCILEFSGIENTHTPRPSLQSSRSQNDSARVSRRPPKLEKPRHLGTRAPATSRGPGWRAGRGAQESPARRGVAQAPRHSRAALLLILLTFPTWESGVPSVKLL